MNLDLATASMSRLSRLAPQNTAHVHGATLEDASP
jgi:hypothetical protein